LQQSHAGAGEVEVLEYQQEMGHFAIDTGADLVIGHHSHQPQPIEVYHGKPILYSLAHVVHDLAGFRRQTLMAILVRCLISDGTIQRLSYVPGIIRGHGPPDFARPAQVPEVVQRMSAMSSPFGTRFEVGEEEVAIALEPAT
jgi:Bacterial capsule synthesis protein PGA_cap